MNKKIKLVFIISLLTLSLIIGINIDKIKFGISLLEIYRHSSPKEDLSSSRDKNNNIKTPVENPLEKILGQAEAVDNPTLAGDIKDKPDPTKNDTSSEEGLIKDLPINNEKDAEKPVKNSGKAGEDTDNESAPRSLKSITEEYNREFLALQNEFEKTLSSLVFEAYNQYKSGQYSKSKLADIYLEKGVELEKSADKRFYALLKEYENDLEENSHDTTIVKELKTYYENFKMERKSEMINKGMEMVKK